MNKITETIDGIEIEFSLRNNNELWLNATKVCKDNKLNLSHFWKSPETKEYIKALTKLTGNFKQTESVELEYWYKESVKGRYGGTFIHPKLKVKFARWVSVTFEIACDEAVESIISNGYYMSEEAKLNPSIKLIQEAKGILNSRLGIDNTRDELIEYISDYLIGQNWNPNSLPSALSSVYQHIHIATRSMIASQILEEEFLKQGKTDKLIITNHRQKRKSPKIYSSDYLIAQNYYSEEEVTNFNKRLNFILHRVSFFINFKLKKLSPQTVIALLKKASRDMVQETSDEINGTKYKGKNAKKLREALSQFNKDDLDYQEALVLIDEIADGNTFELGKS